MLRRSADLLAAGLFTITAAVVILVGVRSSAIRLLAAIPLVFLLPGYALTAALIPKSTLGFPERIGLSLGLSLAVVALGGLVLDWMPWGLRADSWVILLFSVTVGTSLVALLRRRASTGSMPRRLAMGLTAHQIMLFGLAALLASSAIVLVLVGELKQQRRAFTQLWILPANEVEQHTVRVGIHSMESSTKQYRLQIAVAGDTATEWPLIELQPGERWEDKFVFSAEQAKTGMVEAKLYVLDSPDEVYRRVVLRSFPEKE